MQSATFRSNYSLIVQQFRLSLLVTQYVQLYMYVHSGYMLMLSCKYRYFFSLIDTGIILTAKMKQFLHKVTALNIHRDMIHRK